MSVSFYNVDAVLTNTATSILSASTNASLYITRATITNIDASSHNVTIYRVASGGSASNSNIIIDPVAYPGQISAGQTIALPLTGHSLVNGQSLFAKADASNFVNISISYIQQS